MNVRVNEFYLPSQMSVEKTPTMILLAGAISVIIGLMLFREISYGFCGAGILAMGLSRLSPQLLKTRLILYTIAALAFTLCAVSFFKTPFLDHQWLTLAAGSLRHPCFPPGQRTKNNPYGDLYFDGLFCHLFVHQNSFKF